MKTHLKKLFLPSMLLTFLFAFMFTSRADAAYGLTQVNPQQNSITVQWTAPSNRNVTGYTVKVGTSLSDAQPVGTLPASATSYTVPNLPGGCERYIKVEYTYQNSYSTSTYTDYYYGSFRTTPGKVTSVHQDKWWYFIKSFDVKWDEQKAADGYEYVVKKNNKGKKFASGTVSYESLSVSKKVSNSIVYSVQVRAYSTINGTKYTGNWSDVCYCFTQPRVKSAKVKGNKLTIKWGKVSGATGYDIYVSTKPKKGYTKVKSVSSKISSVTITKLKKKKISSKKKYYVYVVTKKKVGKKTSTSGKLYYWNTKNTNFGYF